nr:MAG TPA: hypothetical protein [Caudoviricetes sp.]
MQLKPYNNIEKEKIGAPLIFNKDILPTAYIP